MPLKPRPKPHVQRQARQVREVDSKDVIEGDPVRFALATQRVPASMLSAVAPTPQKLVREVVDRYTGPGGERIVQALAVIALGNAASRMTFFGEPVKVQAKDRTQALSVLADRRWGRAVPEADEGEGHGRMPVQIINVFAPQPEDE